MSGLLLRLAGPMQSWGEHSTFSERDTCAYPTRSGLIGLFASALGRRRGEPIDDLGALEFTVRVDRPGHMMEDFHTVGGGRPPSRTVITAEGKRKSHSTATIVSRRQYLADAVFVVAVTGVTETVGAVASALARPTWAPYLGRRSCPAEPPLLLKWPADNPVQDLQTLPLARKARPGDDGEDVDFVLERRPADGRASQSLLNDVPMDFHPLRRRYLSRSVYVTTVRLPSILCAGIGREYFAAVGEYLEGARTDGLPSPDRT